MSLTKKQSIRIFIKQEEQSGRKWVKAAPQETPNGGKGSDPGANQRPFHQESGNSIEKTSLLAQRKVWKLDSYALVKGWRKGHFNTCDRKRTVGFVDDLCHCK